MDIPRAPDPTPPDRIESSTVVGTHAPIKPRTYTDAQVLEFERADALDGEALRIARRFDRATGLGFFQDAEPDDAPDADRQS